MKRLEGEKLQYLLISRQIGDICEYMLMIMKENLETDKTDSKSNSWHYNICSHMVLKINEILNKFHINVKKKRGRKRLEINMAKIL